MMNKRFSRAALVAVLLIGLGYVGAEAIRSFPAAAAYLPNVNIFVNTNNTNTQPHICGSFKYVHITTATDTQIVNASGSTNIYICDFEFSAAAAQNFYFEKSSTGTCGSPTQIGILWTLVANQGKAASNAYYRGFNTGASQQLCVNTANAAGVDIGVYYDQY